MARRENYSVNKFKVSNSDAVVRFGDGSLDVDVWLYGSTSDNNIIFDASSDQISFDGIDIHLEDGDEIRFGDRSTGDIVMAFSGTDFNITSGSAVEAMNIGGTTNNINVTLKGTFTVGEDDTGYDVKFFGATTGAFVEWDESDDRLEFTLSGIEFISGKSGAEILKFADDGGSACADLASAVGDVNAVIVAKVGSTTTYIPGHVSYTPA